MSRDEILAEAERILREADVFEVTLWFPTVWPGVTVRIRSTGDERDGATLAEAIGGGP